MAVDTPARIAILGAGPIGLEAALYARFLGYEVEIFERGRVCEHLLRWGHLTLFTPFGKNRSRLGLAALLAQDNSWQPPADDEFLSGRELVERYYLPLAQSDLLVDSMHPRTEVTAVGRQWFLKGELPGSDDRASGDFRLLVRGPSSHGGTDRQRIAAADVVIDATGTFGRHCWLGEGGIPAIGEPALEPRIEYGLPDVLGSDRHEYVGRHTLLVGGGLSAATMATALGQLADTSTGTRVTWITRREPAGTDAGLLAAIPNDPLGHRATLVARANQLAAGKHAAVEHRPSTTVGSIFAAAEEFDVELLGLHAGVLRVDRIVANVGYRPDNSIFGELQIALDPANDGPIRLAEELRATDSLDCEPPAWPPALLLNPEPDFYVLGAKSYGRDGRFFIAHGLAQVRDLFTIIGDRPALDLYATIPLPRQP